ncbi:2920_t:CDS:2 [Paraglomus brasilianum]|uniref:Nucleoside diphosphate kinase n=1 Tax=Paraglomus brasilianum TaxID=144538 RepID=A0A9N8Z7C3_9GLOM|nr:2920_t:CDS:2 [Paraglomus brasilianum]
MSKLKQLPQLTLALLKPDIVVNPTIRNQILHKIQSHPHSFTIVEQKDILWKLAQAKAFYKAHEGRFFFERLCGFMTSGKFTALILAREDAIHYWRQLIGPTHPCRARVVAPGTLRATYGLTDTRNSFHGSDSDDTAKREIKLFFPDFDIDEWRRNQNS